ncbi:MAG: serpin family protein [Lachnospiraceae bacterium]|nr:serpin family protein [Lachnospiraceae bacterium]MBR3507394.1 serpin family protein [Lachnospiraceae bacterium]MBR4607999.1 serpin family protein [Lachnospiraceae bacterium]
MKKEKLFEILEDIDEEQVEKAGQFRKKRVGLGVLGTIAAAFLCVMIGVLVILQHGKENIENKVGGKRGAMVQGTGPDCLPTQTPEVTTQPKEQGETASVRLGEWSKEDEGWLSKVTVVDALIPEPIGKGMTADEYLESNLHFQWRNDETYQASRTAANELVNPMQVAYNAIAGSLLTQGEENCVCSPLNVYLALSLLAETTDGNSRKQILDFLGVADIETLRENIDALWSSNYADTPTFKSILGNSLWLRNDTSYNEETLKRLGETYHAFSFVGEMGSEEMNQGLRSWTNRATGGLLEQYVKEMEMSPLTVMEMISTIYFKARWSDPFQEAATKKETFHGTHGDQEADMMHKAFYMAYRSDKVTAIQVNLEDGGCVYFFLPKENVSVEELVTDPEILDAHRRLLKVGEELNELDKETEEIIKTLETEEAISEAVEALWARHEERYAQVGWSYPLVHASIPKFHVDQKTDLIEFLANQGMTDILNSNASDFSPLTKDSKEIFVSKAEHAATVEIDEQGIIGAAYVELGIPLGAAMPREEIDFILDRPFIFVVYSGDGSVLFEGIVRNIE